MVLVPEDSVYELSRAGDGPAAREACQAAAKLVEEDENIDECYKAVLLCLLNGRDENNCAAKKKRIISKDKCAKSSSPLNKSPGKYLEVGSSSKPVYSEVEILDSDDVIARKGISSPFIPSVQYCTLDEDPSATRFRKEVLEAIRKPFNKEEYKKCREEVRDKSYTKHFPGLQKKLTEFRYKKDKCLIILRGFFFWLQNVTREGSFQPWLDKTCLAMELPSC